MQQIVKIIAIIMCSSYVNKIKEDRSSLFCSMKRCTTSFRLDEYTLVSWKLGWFFFKFKSIYLLWRVSEILICVYSNNWYALFQTELKQPIFCLRVKEMIAIIKGPCVVLLIVTAIYLGNILVFIKKLFLQMQSFS
jgi:hypothetical protein